MTEKLTDVQRAMLIAGGHNTALRIIDAHTADRAIVEACLALDADWLRSCEFSRDMRIVNFARAVMRMKESR